MHRVFGFFVGVAVGVLAGTTLGLLFAPASGKDLRARIGERSQAFAADVRQASNTKRIELQERLEILRAPKP